MEEYIYILFAVAYIIYSVIKGAKKVAKNKPVVSEKKSVQQPATRPEQKPVSRTGDEFKKILDEMLGEVPEVIIPEKQKPVPRPQPVSSGTPKTRQPKISLFKNEYLKKSKTLKPEAAPKPFLPAEKHKRVTETKEPVFFAEEEPVFEFDARKAIIYSEILKRPGW
jgi:hypothetical protein